MKFIHTADLHLGKKLSEFSLLEDQRYFLFDVLLKEAKGHNVDAILLSGDIYDTTVPGQSAMLLLNEFLTSAVESHIKVLLIPGNHDSAEKLSFLSTLVRKDGLYLVTTLKEAETPIKINGVNFYCLPFLKHFDVNHEYGVETKTYEEAVCFMISKMNVDVSKSNVILAHQTVFPVNGELIRSESEEPSAGNVPNVASQVFKDFDYVALGHIHKPQKVGRVAYYAGSPLKYHVDEAGSEKFINLVSIKDKVTEVERIHIVPRRDVKLIEGRWENLLSMKKSEDYVYLLLDEENRIDNAMEKARTTFPNCCAIAYKENSHELTEEEVELPDGFDKADPSKELASFFSLVTGEELTEYQKGIIAKTFEELKGEKQ